MKASLQSRILAGALVFLAASALAAPDRMPTPEEAGVPERFRPTVMGGVVLNTGGTTALTMDRQGNRDLDTNEKITGSFSRCENASWTVFGPGEIIKQGTDSATVKATGEGQGYIQGHRYVYYKENGKEKRSLLIQIWILVVNKTGQVGPGDGSVNGPGLPDSRIPPDIPRAVIKGRAVMRGTRDGVPDAAIELVGDKTGTLRADWKTGADGSFTITANNQLSVDRYEVFVRKGSTNVARQDAVMEDLWPIHKYRVSLNNDNCRNLDVGLIEMASVENLWGGTGSGADRKDYDCTPRPTAGPSSTAGQSSSAGSGTGSSLPLDSAGGSVPILIAAGAIGARNAPANTNGPASNTTSATLGSVHIDYKGYVEVDSNLKATLSLQLNGSAVSGELYAPPVAEPNVRLPGARVQLQGTLTGGWEDGGSIAGKCAGCILWPGGNEEARTGQFQIVKSGREIHFRSTKFYYNRYIFGAQGIKYAAAGVTNAPGNTNASGTYASSVVILIDASGSMQGAKLNNAKATARQRIAGLDPAIELAVIAFSGNSLKFPFAAMNADGRAQAQAAVDGISASGDTPLAAAIRGAGEYMRGNACGKRLTLIILSDGEETGGGNPPEEVRRLNNLNVNW